MRITWFSALSYSAHMATSVPINMALPKLENPHKHTTHELLIAQTHTHTHSTEKSVFDELGDDTVEAVNALKMLGGVDADALDNFVPEPIEFP